MRKASHSPYRLARTASLFLLGSFLSPSIWAAPDVSLVQAGTPSGQGLPFSTIQEALNAAHPGDTVRLETGVYRENLYTVRSGTEDHPIRITGPINAMIIGNGGGKIIQLRHSHVTLEGFSVDGRFKADMPLQQIAKKLVYVMAEQPDAEIKGVRLLNMDLRNARDECIRLKHFVSNTEIAFNRIRNCGLEDFQLGGNGKNGEGIYIGTAPEQFHLKGFVGDTSHNNHVHHNDIETHGAECVDIKEHAHHNRVENNQCRAQRDPDSAGLGSRGSHNRFVNNNVSDCWGAGVRLGGDEANQGTHNTIRDNKLQGCLRGGIKVMRAPQGRVCGNQFLHIPKGKDITGAKRQKVKNLPTCPDD